MEWAAAARPHIQQFGLDGKNETCVSPLTKKGCGKSCLARARRLMSSCSPAIGNREIIPSSRPARWGRAPWKNSLIRKIVDDEKSALRNSRQEDFLLMLSFAPGRIARHPSIRDSSAGTVSFECARVMQMSMLPFKLMSPAEAGGAIAVTWPALLGLWINKRKLGTLSLP